MVLKNDINFLNYFYNTFYSVHFLSFLHIFHNTYWVFSLFVVFLSRTQYNKYNFLSNSYIFYILKSYLYHHISITEFFNFINFYTLSSGYFTRFSRIVNQLIKLHIFYFLILFIEFFCHSSCFILEHLLQYLAGFFPFCIYFFPFFIARNTLILKTLESALFTRFLDLI